ncbi:hypothetical protein HWV62_38070 [Athelia sp. TMB]|nr:hypothetical protein HWV62_38070 [Athelia sp. TMB]
MLRFLHDEDFVSVAVSPEMEDTDAVGEDGDMPELLDMSASEDGGSESESGEMLPAEEYVEDEGYEVLEYTVVPHEVTQSQRAEIPVG